MKNKMPRFVVEYANYQKKTIKNIEGFTTDKKKEIRKQIDRVLQGLERGLITISETMTYLTTCIRRECD